MVATTEVTMEAMAAMATTARGLLRLSPVTAMAAMEATTEVTMEAMAATARGLLRLSPVTAMAAMVATTEVTMEAMAAMDATTEVTMEATAITVEKRHHHLNLQTYKSLCICDQLRVLNYARNKKK